MKIEIYQEPAVQDQPVLRLRLVKVGEDVVLAAVGIEGDILVCGNLLTIGPSGRFVRNVNVSLSLGLYLDNQRRIIIDPE